MSSMRVIQVAAKGGAFELVERALPEPGRGEVRVKVAARRYRVPDVAVFAEPARGSVVLEPPLAIFEILSP